MRVLGFRMASASPKGFSYMCRIGTQKSSAIIARPRRQHQFKNPHAGLRVPSLRSGVQSRIWDLVAAWCVGFELFCLGFGV